MSGSGGYGFIAKVESMCARNKGGKGFVTIQDGETLCQPSVIGGTNGSVELPDATHVACVSTALHGADLCAVGTQGLTSGGRGLQLMKVEDRDALVGAAAYTRSMRITGRSRPWR